MGGEFGVEALVSFGDGGVDGDEAIGFDGLGGLVEGVSGLGEGSEAFDEEEGGVSFVEVVDG